MEIVKSIRDLLHQYSCVTIPGFGSFVVRYKPAQMNPVENVFEPPGKVVAFNASIKDDDSLLVNHLSETSDMDAEAVRKNIATYIDQVKKRLDKKEPFEFKEIGTLSKDDTGKYHFEPHISANFNGDAFGLEPLKVKKKSREKKIPEIKKPLAPRPESGKAKTKTVEKKKKSSPAILIVSVLAVAAIALFVLIYTGIINVKSETWLYFTDKIAFYDNTDSPSGNNGDYLTDSTTLNDPVARSIDSLTDKKTALSPPAQQQEENNFPAQNTHYHIIGGSFTSMENAEEFLSKFRKEGYNPTIIEGSNNFYRVSLKSFTNKDSALEELMRIRRLPEKENTWILSI